MKKSKKRISKSTRKSINKLYGKIGKSEPNYDGKQEHDVIMAAIGSPNEGDGQEHDEIMREICGY